MLFTGQLKLKYDIAYIHLCRPDQPKYGIKTSTRTHYQLIRNKKVGAEL